VTPDPALPNNDIAEIKIEKNKPISLLALHFIMRGSYRVVGDLGAPEATRSGTYLWTSPMNGFDPGAIAQAYNDRFFRRPEIGRESPMAPITMICLLDDEATGRDQFQSAHPIPTGWAASVIPAVKFIRANPYLWDADTAQKVSRLRELEATGNPLISIASIRALCSVGQFSQTDLDGILRAEDADLIAAAIGAIVAVNGPVKANDDVLWLDKNIKSTKSLSVLEGLSVGAADALSIVRGFVPYDRPSNPNPHLLSSYLNNPTRASAIGTKLSALDPSGSAKDPVWNAVHTCAVMWSSAGPR